MRYLFRASLVSSLLLAQPSMATVLTFDVDPPVSNSEAIDQDYGDRVVTTNDVLNNFQYGVGGEGFTPNVITEYVGATGFDPNLWSTGYGDLTNIYFDDDDNNGNFGIEFTADPGFEVGLHGFDLAWFFDGSATIDSLTVLDSEGNPLLSLTDVVILGGSSHSDFDFMTPFFDDVITVLIDAGNLGNLSDDIGYDNVVFSQRVAPIPLPAAAWLFASGIGLLGLCRRRRRC